MKSNPFSCRRTTLSTVDVLPSHPAESGNLANRTTLWKSQKRGGGKRTLGSSAYFTVVPGTIWDKFVNNPTAATATFVSVEVEAVSKSSENSSFTQEIEFLS